MTAVGLISDIHGNCVALDAVLRDLERRGVPQVVCLGDAIQSGPQPRQVVERLQNLNCPVVMGNADAWLLSGDNSATTDTDSPEQQAIRSWSFAQLTESDIAYMSGFRPTVTFRLGENRSLFGFHGSPGSHNDLILPTTDEVEFQRHLAPYQDHICAGGHTHWQCVRRLAGSYFVNPGSVGWAYDRYAQRKPNPIDPWAEYGVITEESGVIRIELFRVAYDVEAYHSVVRASGRPYGEELIARFLRRPDDRKSEEAPRTQLTNACS